MKKIFSKDVGYLRSYWKYLIHHRYSLYASLLLIPFISLFHLLQPYVIKRGIDGPILNKTIEGLWELTLAFAFLIVLEFLSRAVQSYLFQKIGILSVTEIRRDLCQYIQSLPSSFFDKTPKGTLVTKLTSDIEALNETFSSGVITLLSDILTILGILLVMLILSFKLTLALLCIFPFLIFLINFFRVRLRWWFSVIRTQLGKLNAYLQEQIEGVEVVQNWLREKVNYDTFIRKHKAYKKAVLHSVFYDSFLFSVVEVAGAISIALLIGYGFSLLKKGELSLGVLVAFLEYIRRLFYPLKELSAKFATLQGALAALEKIFGTFQGQDETQWGETHLDEIPELIEFKNVSFNYPGHEKQVLDQVSFSLKRGEVVAIVGSSGSGKTTIGRLLLRFYDNYEGEILINRHEMRALSKDSLRENFSVVLQDSSLFSDSIENNISLYREDIHEKELDEVIQLVQAETIVDRSPARLKTFLKNKGIELSLGERQLLTFARALLGDPPFILLDEATASIDSMCEQKIQQALSKIFEEKTVLIIAHRLSTVQQADKIIALKRGRIEEMGTHEELLKNEGYYYRLCKMNFVV